MYKAGQAYCSCWGGGARSEASIWMEKLAQRGSFNDRCSSNNMVAWFK
jgi:hypothetical protein